MTPEQILALRTALGMTQEEFAARVGLKTRGAVSKLEKGAKQAKGPLLAALRLLAQAREGGHRGKR